MIGSLICYLFRTFQNQDRYTKDPVFYSSVKFDKSLISILDPQTHKKQRQPLETLFTTRALQDLYPILKDVTDGARSRLDTAYELNRTVDFTDLAARITVGQ